MADIVYRWKGGAWVSFDGDFAAFKLARNFSSVADDFSRGKGKGFAPSDIETITGLSVDGPESESWVHYLIGLKDDGRVVHDTPMTDLEFFIRSTKL